MPNVISRIAPEPVAAGYRHSPVLDIVLRSMSNVALVKHDLLRYFPTEIRLMIFEELLVVNPKTVFRGAHEFGPLDDKEFSEEIPIPWQILLTCRKYHEECVPIMYGKNRFVFCTGAGGEPGQFWRFPIHSRYMHYLTDLGIYLRADDPNKEAARRVGLFLKAIARLATNLKHLTVMVSSDRFYDAVCPWDILFGDHPVAEALVFVTEAQNIKHLKIRLHDGACLFPVFASFLSQNFYGVESATNRSITFTRSCTCPPACPHIPATTCFMCGFPKDEKHKKPIEVVMSNPSYVEAGETRMMNLQADLFELGLLPPTDDDDDVEEVEADANGGLHMTGFFEEDDYEENRLAFSSGFLLPGQSRHYRGEVRAPKEWSFKQLRITDYFSVVQYEEYLDDVFGSAA
ncbi:hypothetical protein BDV95DRAFT_483284 [Massariosphaeria phaeospora]|uniref:Uncharacterized protein n=1 Tax=Massariosphaeria phaeospora TaxID=100035 RepID=A0A7C8IDA7_9PLEO|nr:hypothetical protein BDV95DRAFT_483284 [Massariosphaeria phaeospora]